MARVLIKEIKDAKKNYILNGNFELWQRTSANQTFGSLVRYHADRFAWASGTITGQVSSSRGAVGSYSNSSMIPRVCTYMQQYTVSTAQPSLSADSTAGPWYKIEGYDLQNMLDGGALTNGFTLSFYVASSVTGTYTIELFNSGIDNRYFTTYTISAANTWQRVSIYFSPLTVATGIGLGTWNYTNGLGLTIRFWLACGTNSQGSTQNAWTGSTANVPATQVNFLSTLSNTWGLTGLMVTLGNVLPEFKTRGESFSDELRLCQRYYEKSYNVTTSPGSIIGDGLVTGMRGSGGFDMSARFATVKRTSPTITIYSPVTGNSGVARNDNLGADEAATATQTGFSGLSIGGTTVTVNTALSAHWTADAEL